MRRDQPPITNEEHELINDIAAFEVDPYPYVLYSYPWGEDELADFDGPDIWQKKVLLDIGDKLRRGLLNNFADVIREATASGHGVGKSALVAWLINWAMDTHEDTRGVVTANTETQLRTKTWPEVQKWSRLRVTAHWTTVTATAIYSNAPGHESNWRIDAIPWSKEKPEAFAGLHNKGKRILMIFDEASTVDDSIWEVAEGAMTDENTQIIWCAFGNPTRNTGRFRECWRKYRSMWQTWEVDSRNAKMSNKKLIDEWINVYGIDSDFVKVRVLGQFPASSDRQFISTDLVDKARRVILREEQFNFAPVIIGVDPAWTGGDETVIWLRQGLFTKKLAVFPRNDNDFELAGYVANFETQYNADAVFIDQGYGTGIYSAGKQMGRKWILVSFGAKSPDLGYYNLRAYMWGQIKKWLQDGGMLPHDDQTMADDLIGPEYEVKMDGRILLESKEDMKDRGLPSPNRADALALTFAYPVQKKGFTTQTQVKTAYNPYKRR